MFVRLKWARLWNGTRGPPAGACFLIDAMDDLTHRYAENDAISGSVSCNFSVETGLQRYWDWWRREATENESIKLCIQVVYSKVCIQWMFINNIGGIRSHRCNRCEEFKSQRSDWVMAFMDFLCATQHPPGTEELYQPNSLRNVILVSTKVLGSSRSWDGHYLFQ